MNTTVTRIVELMFQDVEMSEEVQAIRDEVMNNCQERFDDLMARGLSEDEAIKAVVESLDGMKEVLAGYPRKELPDDEDEDDEEDEDDDEEEDEDEGNEVVYSAQGVSQVAVELLSECLEVGVSDDHKIHVIADEDTWPQLKVNVAGGVLRIGRISDKESDGIGKENRGFNFHMKMKDDDGKYQHVDVGSVIGDTMMKISKAKLNHTEMKDQELNSIIKNATDKIGSFFKSWNMNIQIGDDTVTLLLPAEPRLMLSAQTTSGDVSVEDAALSELKIVTLSGDISVAGMAGELDRCEIKSTSGDVDIEDMKSLELRVTTISGDVDARIPERHEVAHCTLKSTSGDLTLDGNVMVGEIASISGDLDVRGRMVRLNTQSTSGDITVRAEMDDMNFSTINGDVEVDVCRAATSKCSVTGKSTSGDIIIRLPEDEAHVQAKSTFGDVRIGQSLELNKDSDFIITATSMNGDITIK